MSRNLYRVYRLSKYTTILGKYLYIALRVLHKRYTGFSQII